MSNDSLQRAGFEAVTTEQRYYGEGDRLNCPDCGEECERDATFYVRTTGKSTGNEVVRT